MEEIWDSTQLFVTDTEDRKSLPRPSHISITQETFHWNVQGRDHSIKLDHIIGAAHVRKRMGEKPNFFDICSAPEKLGTLVNSISSTPTGFWSIFAMVIEKNKKGDIRNPRVREVRFSSEGEGASSEECVAQLKAALGYFDPSIRDKKMMFILNPFGGTKSSKKIYHRIVVPMLKLAGLNEYHELIETLKPEHATEIGKTLDVSKYRCVATISGDGVFHELLNGLLSRKDWKVASQIPLGTVGSANAVGKNIDTRDQRLAVLNILKCRTRKMDVFSIVQNNTVSYSHLMVSWGFIADVDLDSEKYRYLGELRMTLMAIIRLIKLRSYRGRIYCLPPSEAERYELKDTFPLDGPRPRYTSPGSTAYKQWPVKADSIFQYFLASNFPWISSDFLSAPTTTFDDGLMHVVYSEKMNRTNTLSCVLDSERGVHLTYGFIEHLAVKAFVLEPSGLVPDDGNLEKIEENLTSLNLDISGERVPYSPIQIEVLPGIINLICPEWLDHHRWARTFKKEFLDHQ